MTGAYVTSSPSSERWQQTRAALLTILTSSDYGDGESSTLKTDHRSPENVSISKHIVVSAGPVGTGTALRLAEQGEQVVVVTMSGSGPTHQRVGRTAADASSVTVTAMTELATGAVAIYNCATPAYHCSPSDRPPMAQALLTSAERSGAVLATVSNLYGYGPVSSPLTEDLPLAAHLPKALIRVQMWRDALAAHVASRVRVTEVRGSDYLRHGTQSHLGDRVVPRPLAGHDVTVTRSADTLHTWTATDVLPACWSWWRPMNAPGVGPGTCRATRHGASARLWVTGAVSQESSQ